MEDNFQGSFTYQETDSLSHLNPTLDVNLLYPWQTGIEEKVQEMQGNKPLFFDAGHDLNYGKMVEPGRMFRRK